MVTINRFAKPVPPCASLSASHTSPRFECGHCSPFMSCGRPLSRGKSQSQAIKEMQAVDPRAASVSAAVMMLWTLLLVAAVAVTQTVSRLVLRTPYDLYFFHDYQSNPNSGSHTYEQAKLLCESLGGQLPSFHTQADIDFVLNRLIGERAKGAHIWSGLYWSDTLNSQVKSSVGCRSPHHVHHHVRLSLAGMA